MKILRQFGKLNERKKYVVGITKLYIYYEEMNSCRSPKYKMYDSRKKGKGVIRHRGSWKSKINAPKENPLFPEKAVPHFPIILLRCFRITAV